MRPEIEILINENYQAQKKPLEIDLARDINRKIINIFDLKESAKIVAPDSRLNLIIFGLFINVLSI
mgnify:CR=1 FL=1